MPLWINVVCSGLCCEITYVRFRSHCNNSVALIAQVPRLRGVRLASTGNDRAGACDLVNRWAQTDKRLEAKLIAALGDRGAVLADGAVKDRAVLV